MKVTNVYRKGHLTPAQMAKESEVREMFQDWKPGPEELLASGRWQGPVLVEGQQEFWKVIRRLRSFREAQGLTLKDVSERCGIDVATLSKLENGKQANPTLFTILLYVGAVGGRLHFSVSKSLAGFLEGHGNPGCQRGSERCTTGQTVEGQGKTQREVGRKERGLMPVLFLLPTAFRSSL